MIICFYGISSGTGFYLVLGFLLAEEASGERGEENVVVKSDGLSVYSTSVNVDA